MEAWPFVGRDGELAAIEGAFAGSDVDAVVVAGPAGVGKTALAREALGRLRGTGCRVEWVAGTRAAASIPFGAVAQLVPPRWRPAGGPLGVLRAVAGHVGGWGGRRRVVLGVDDAHLLDDPSAAVVAHLVAERLAFVVVTLRTGEPVPDAVTALWKEGRAERLDLDGLPPGDVDPALWAVTRAETLYWGLGNSDAAELLLGGQGDLADGTLTWIRVFDGRCVEALDTAHRVLDRPGVHPQGVIRATAGGTAAAGFLGRLGESAAIRARGLPVAAAYREPMPWGVYEIEIADCLAHLAAGDLTRAWAIADRGYRQAVEAGVPMMVSGWALFGGQVAAARGHLDTAGALLREAVAGFEENDTFRFRRHCAATLAAVNGLRGDPEEATRWLAEADDADSGANRIFAPWLELARAWVAMSRGAQADAVACAGRAADLARDAALPTAEAAALYDAGRLGGSVDRRRLDALASQLGTPFAEALALAAHGLSRGDGGPLSRAAEVFERLGQDLLAAEAGAAAARMFRRAGQRGQAHLVRSRSAAARTRCAPARTPLLVNDEVAELLTAREREVVLLAAHHSSRHIAERLGLQVKTVNNHLARAYAKLGISSRAEVRALLGQ